MYLGAGGVQFVVRLIQGALHFVQSNLRRRQFVVVNLDLVFVHLRGVELLRRALELKRKIRVFLFQRANFAKCLVQSESSP